jgi:hypothetical protein
MVNGPSLGKQAIINRSAGYGSMAGPAGQELQPGPSDWAGDGAKLQPFGWQLSLMPCCAYQKDRSTLIDLCLFIPIGMKSSIYRVDPQ